MNTEKKQKNVSFVGIGWLLALSHRKNKVFSSVTKKGSENNRSLHRVPFF